LYSKREEEKSSSVVVSGKAVFLSKSDRDQITVEFDGPVDKDKNEGTSADLKD